MEKIFNDFNLKKPPFVTLPAKHSHAVLKLHEVIESFISKHAKYEQEFNETAALLSRLIARRKNSFNKMKGFKDVCKLNTSLCRLLRVDFKRDIDNFRNTLPDVNYEEGTIIQLPTRDSFDFVLIRLISIYELYRRIVDCCISAAEYFTCQIRIHFFFETNTLLLAVLSKIHSMSINLLGNAVDLYNNSLSCRLVLPLNLKTKFLKDSPFDFPDKLEIIKLNSLESENISTKGQQPLKELLHQEENVASVKALKLKKTDVGEAVKRSSKFPENICIEKLNTVEEIKRFIGMESKSRSKNLNSCFTKKILEHEWAGVKKLFVLKVQKGEVKKAVNIFRNFLTLKVNN